MTVIEQPTVFDALDGEQQPTPAFEQYRRQRGERQGDHVLPRGTYEANLIEVHLVRRKDGSGFLLRLIARTIGLGKYVIAWRGLTTSPTDPWDLTDTEVKSLRKWAISMGVPVPAPAQEIVAAVERLAAEGAQVEAKVAHTPAGIQTVLTRLDRDRAAAASSTTLTVNGRTIDVDGVLIEDPAALEGKARDAHEDHAKLLHGLGQVRLGLVEVAEACYRLRKSQGWLALGFESLNEYLAQPEITYSRTEFYRSADIWESYVLEGEIDPVLLQGAEASKLEVPLAALKQGLVDAERAAADAESMTRSDLRTRYKELLGGTADEGSDGTSSATAAEESDSGQGAPDPEFRRRDVYDDEVAEVERLRGVESKLTEAEQRAEAWKDDSTKAHSQARTALDRVVALDAEVVQLRTELEQASALEMPEDLAEQMDAAKGAVSVLRRVLDEVGRPEQKRMGKELRGAVIAALENAESFGLGEGS